MPIEQINNTIIINNENKEKMKYYSTKDDEKLSEIVTDKVFVKKNEFKQRGVNVVKAEIADKWINFVDDSLANSDLYVVWENGACIEAALQCMERLSQGLPVKDAYLPIKINTTQDPNDPCVHLGYELGPWQNHTVASIVFHSHERGQEFWDYRKDYVESILNSKAPKR